MIFIDLHRSLDDSIIDRLCLPAAPPLDFTAPPALQKLSTFAIGSPGRATSPPAVASALLSPGVGEFKGWFSNLFHWRVQTLCLYSVLDVATTRVETTRLLEHFGVSISTEEKTGLSVLFCRVDDAHDAQSQNPKQVRFRVEFTSCTGSAGSGSGPGASTSSSRPQLTFSQAAAAAVATKSRGENLAAAAGYDTMIGIALEKGSVSTFKNLCQRLRTEWRLDALVSPAHAQGVTPGIEQTFLA